MVDNYISACKYDFYTFVTFSAKKTITKSDMPNIKKLSFFQMGYANIKQRGQGLHLRQFSRAFIIDDGQKRVVFVSVDGAMISHAVKRNVCAKNIFIQL